MSRGERLSPAFPPIVPRIPEMDFIKVISIQFQRYKIAKKTSILYYHQLIVPLQADY
jgi:hypothetical protein